MICLRWKHFVTHITTNIVLYMCRWTGTRCNAESMLLQLTFLYFFGICLFVLIKSDSYMTDTRVSKAWLMVRLIDGLVERLAFCPLLEWWLMWQKLLTSSFFPSAFFTDDLYKICIEQWLWQLSKFKLIFKFNHWLILVLSSPYR